MHVRQETNADIAEFNSNRNMRMTSRASQRFRVITANIFCDLLVLVTRFFLEIMPAAKRERACVSSIIGNSFEQTNIPETSFDETS